jgi:prevent-host-death family protein
VDSFTVAEAKARLADIIERVASGEEVVLTRRGDQVARIVPMERRTNILGAGRLDPNLNEDAIARDEWWKRGR